MRDVAVTEGDKVEAELRFGVSVNTYGVNDLVAVVDAVRRRGDRRAGRRSTPTRTTSRRSCCPGGERHDSLRYGARIELGLRAFLADGGFTAFTTNFEDLGGLRQLPGLAVQRLMADGYGFGGEGDWKTSVLLRTLKVMADGLPGGTSFMEDYTYHLVPGEEQILGAHMLEVCPSHRGRAAVLRDPPARHRRPRGPGPAGLRRRPRRRGHRRHCPTSATGSGSSPTRSRSSRPTSRCRSSRSPGPCGARRPTSDLDGVLADRRRAAPHGALDRARRRAPRRPRRHGAAPSWCSSTATPRSAGSARSCAGTRPTTDSRRGSECLRRQEERRTGTAPEVRARTTTIWRSQCAG